MSRSNYRIILYEGEKGAHVYHMPPRTWRRAARIMDRYGPDEALQLLDARANNAVDRGDISCAVRWRDVMAAIHAVIKDEPEEGEALH
jgi:hypothetical protein